MLYFHSNRCHCIISFAPSLYRTSHHITKISSCAFKAQIKRVRDYIKESNSTCRTSNIPHLCGHRTVLFITRREDGQFTGTRQGGSAVIIALFSSLRVLFQVASIRQTISRRMRFLAHLRSHLLQGARMSPAPALSPVLEKIKVQYHPKLAEERRRSKRYKRMALNKFQQGYGWKSSSETSEIKHML
ncbi:hypothetical protein BDZ97DRAFT_1152007 [Flammula alnicola]|nr:hypothetical protein BDZ97DRAFT_1152007 [Flammula alnicola]